MIEADGEYIGAKNGINLPIVFNNEIIGVIAVVGQVLGDQNLYLAEGIDYIVVTNYLKLPFEEVKKRAESDMIHTFNEFLNQMK